MEELHAAGITPHVAGPAGTAALRGKKRDAKTETRHLRVHLMAGDLPECWIPPGHVLEARATARLYKDLVDERAGGTSGSLPPCSTRVCPRRSR